ncbi:AAA family ATPase [Gloeocapsa sp. PCC 73106]|uniref:AAA family ATPase n=1 Tax=Gloeocapsa sp. PCC 73106 TaxID=102232 RepID=UPI0002ABCF43|nr:AAA family ATPase [Gloeocapsa sp. PCC 73106]ELR96702.1 hypothetical protein GLO73106DRAFT_00004990 [Gloeocapsa sp. PCC 73106]
MKIFSLQLCNFRQFYGKTPVIYFASGERNTTVIHGNNGAGKTTLLNAFTWILYEKFTPAFASPNVLVNKRALKQNDFNASVECSGTLEFEHDSKKYQVQRKFYAYFNKNNVIEYGNINLYMHVIGDDGRWNPPTEKPEDVIEQILPQSLHHYFFFDGEHIEHISRSEQKTNLAEDTKELIGIKVLDRAIEHVKKAKKTLQEELTLIGDSQIKKILEEQHKSEKQQEILLNKIDKSRLEIERYEREKEVINQELLGLNGAKQMQKSKIELEAEEKKVRQELQQVNLQIKNQLSTQAYTIFLSETFAQFQNCLAKMREKGQLPSGIKQQFVEQLLEQQECICGRELVKETEAYQAVEAWTNKAGSAEIEETAIRLEAKVNDVEESLSVFWQRFDTNKAKVNNLREQLAENETKLDNLKEKLRNYPEADVKQQQEKLDAVERKIKELTLELGGDQQQLKTIESSIDTNQKQIDKHKVKEEKQAQAKRRIEGTKEIIERLSRVKELLEKQFRLSLEQKVQEIFSQISFTSYIPRLNERYELNLVENTCGIAQNVAASTGENQILSLSFIGGIIDRVRTWSEQNNLIGPDSSTFPVVMDSPFGSLDEIYRRQVAQSIPKLANQLVIMVTKTQWRGEVEEEVQPYLGREYVLVYHSSKPDCEEDTITIDNQIYPLVGKSANVFEYTEIIEVNKSWSLNNVVRT